MTAGVLVCINCARPVEFGDGGWKHRAETPECRCATVAWPPPVEHDEDPDQESAA